MGNYEKAEPLLKQALAIDRKVLGEENPSYAISLGNLANLYSSMGNDEEALIFYKRVLDIHKKTLGEEHPDYAISLSNLAWQYSSIGNFRAADSLYQKVLSIRKKVLGGEHPDYAITLNNLAQLYCKMGDYAAAESQYNQAMIILKKALGENHPDYVLCLNNLANLYEVTGNYVAAVPLILQAIALEKQFLIDKLNFLSESELLSYVNENESSFLRPLSIVYQNNSDTLKKLVYNNLLFLNGLSILNGNSLSRQITQTKDSTLIKKWNAYLNNKVQLSKILSMPLTGKKIKTDSLANLCNEQEKDLLRSCAAFRNMKDELNITWRDVRKSLKPQEAAIEFIRFDFWNKKWTDSILYAALLVRPQDTVPVLVNLFEEKELRELLSYYANGASLKNRGVIIDRKANSHKDVNSQLYNLVWQPLNKYLQETRTIYFKPDGILNQLAFAALPKGKDSLLADYYQLVQLSSTRQLAIKKEKELFPSSIALFGGIDFEQQDSSLSVTGTNTSGFVYSQKRAEHTESFNYLPGTLKEINNIRQSLSRQHMQVQMFTSRQASEAAFRHLSPDNKSPGIIHIATHGFSLPDVPNKSEDLLSHKTNVFKVSDDPLLRCGLIMAGGNKGWQGKSLPGRR